MAVFGPAAISTSHIQIRHRLLSFSESSFATRLMQKMLPTVRNADLAPPPHRLAPWRATAVLAVLLAVGWLAMLQFHQHASQRISVDMLDLLPRDEQDPTIRLSRQTVSGTVRPVGAHRPLRPGAPGQRLPVEAAAGMAKELAADPAFSGVFAGMTPEAKDRLIEPGSSPGGCRCGCPGGSTA